MTRSAPWGAALIGIAALGMVVYRASSGDWTMPLIVGIGVSGALAVLVLWWLWDRRLFAKSIRQLRATKDWDLVVGGYLVQTELKNVGERKPGRGEMVLAAGPVGIRLFDPRLSSSEPVLRLAWTDVIDLMPGVGEFLQQSQPALVLATMFGRLTMVLRTNEQRGIMSVGSAETDDLIQRIRQLRPNAKFE